jgi:hypothetical protein
MALYGCDLRCPLHVDTRRRSNVSNAQIAVIAKRVADATAVEFRVRYRNGLVDLGDGGKVPDWIGDQLGRPFCLRDVIVVTVLREVLSLVPYVGGDWATRSFRDVLSPMAT